MNLIRLGLFIFGALHSARSEIDNNSVKDVSKNSPYLELILCPVRSEFWECAKKQTKRLLDSWNSDLYLEWQKLKVEGDEELKRKLGSRGFSLSEDVKEKPSTIMSKIQVGANYIRNFVASTVSQYLGFEESEEDITSDESDERDLSDSNRTDHREMRKKKPLHGLTHVDLGHILDILNGHGIKHGIKFPIKYGRSVGVQRGKKKKKKQLLMKLMLIATLIKGKIELLLKIFTAHLQVKFFLIALVGLLINLARFWLDIRRGVIPQKVIYYEHSHHQHHYDDHGSDWGGGEEAGGGGSGGYWKRSLHFDGETPHPTSYSEIHGNLGNDEQYSQKMAYSRQIPRI